MRGTGEAAVNATFARNGDRLRFLDRRSEHRLRK
jgi:hypothetical protein